MKDNFIRDITKVIPISKSEARRRLDEVIKEEIKKEYERGRKSTIDAVTSTLKKIT
jgi:hypothetical protein